jgi:hypothetical protein
MPHVSGVRYSPRPCPCILTARSARMPHQGQAFTHHAHFLGNPYMQATCEPTIMRSAAYDSILPEMMQA